MKPVRLQPTVRLEPVEGFTQPSLLAQLNAHVNHVSTTARGSDAMVANGPWPELRSAARFRETWERLSAETQVQKALARAPKNAGPLNPQRLMLDTLARMGGLSPHYLRRFLMHTETLLWLEQAQGQLKQAPGAKAGPPRARKAGRQRR
jgi:hypothetical protein